MIEQLKIDLNERFLNEILHSNIPGSEEYIFEITPELFECYSDKEEHMYGYDYHPGILRRLNILKNLGVISYYEKINEVRYTKQECFDLFASKGNPVSKNFYYYYQEEGGDYDIELDKRKLLLLKDILHKTKKLKLNIKMHLFKTIFYLMQKDLNNLSKEVVFNVFDIDIILDVLEIEKNIFYDIEILIYSLALDNNRIYMAKFLNYLVSMYSGTEQEILINAIQGDKVYSYYSDEELKNSRDAELYIQSNSPHDISIDTYDKVIDDVIIGNIGYKDENSTNNINIGNNNFKVEYDYDSKTLIFNGKKGVFAGGGIQISFIELLYQNINTCVPESEFKKVGVKTPKDKLDAIREKLEKQYGVNKFTGLETRTLISDFKYAGVKYYIMHG